MGYFRSFLLPESAKDFPLMSQPSASQPEHEQPGQFPYTRGIYKDMYRGRLWTMRQYAGFGSAEESNQRYRYLLSQGTTGLSVAFRMAFLPRWASDPDHPSRPVKWARVGVSIASIADMERLFEPDPARKNQYLDDH